MRYGIQKMLEGWFCFMFFIMGISNGEKKLAFTEYVLEAEIGEGVDKFSHSSRGSRSCRPRAPA